MQIEQRTSYLVLHDIADSQTRRVSLVETLEEAIASWTPGSRLSPIWPVSGYDCSHESMGAEQHLLFLGPVQPARLTSEIGDLVGASDCGIWMTAGCLNVLVRLPVTSERVVTLENVTSWARASSIAHEVWTVRDGVVTGTRQFALTDGDYAPILSRLASALNRTPSPPLKTALQENLIVTATSLSRARAVSRSMLDDLSVISVAGCEVFEAYEAGKVGVLDMQSRLMTANAAMSRFSSQAFSGTPPIHNTECHFWIHSLLGTGSANLALAALVKSIQQVLGEARLPERLQALENVTDGVPDLAELVSSPKVLAFDLLPATQVEAGQPIIPLVTYFSGRDGFSSHVQTLSAPLTTVSECNSLRSNMLTVTHEISHIFVQAALGVLSPTLDDETDIAWAREIIAPNFKAANWLTAARQLLLEALVTMQSADSDISYEQLDNELPQMLEAWRKELQEILVHAFDFLYFHQSDPAQYVTSIWHSWCSIPGIEHRVSEYVMRTMCAISANLLDEEPGKRFPAAIAATKDILEAVGGEIDLKGNYVERALALLEKLETDHALRGRMEKQYGARLYLVRLVKSFLYSETLAARLFNDPYARASSADADKRRLRYDIEPLGNGLTFLKRQLKSNPHEAESIWVLHCLAFDLRSSPASPSARSAATSWRAPPSATWKSPTSSAPPPRSQAARPSHTTPRRSESHVGTSSHCRVRNRSRTNLKAFAKHTGIRSTLCAATRR